MLAPLDSAVPLLRADGATLLFGGCYGNLEATLALRAESARLGIPPECVVCTGDVVAYCADPVATVAVLREWGVHVVMGNCEESLGWEKPDCGCGFAEGTACGLVSTKWYAHANGRLQAADRAWMRALPRRIDLELGGRRVAIVHGSVDLINRFVFASTAWEEKLRQLKLAGCDGVIGGHCGVPFTQCAGGKLWHNAGAIGMPANDGTPRVWYSVLRPVQGGVELSTRALAYDAETAARKMLAAGLPEGYASALTTGLWPSCDALPAPELSYRGQALAEGGVLWNDAPSAWPALHGRPRTLPPKFSDPELTATGHRRASVSLTRLDTVWFNTGSLCNLACANCFMESSPKNDRLAYLTRSEVRGFLDEAAAREPRHAEIGFTGGEPFMNPEILGMLEDALEAGFRVLALTNAMRPMQRVRTRLLDLHRRFPGALSLRISLDHPRQDRHEQLRGEKSWCPAIEGLKWLLDHGFRCSIAGRNAWGESEAELRSGYQALFARLGIALDAQDPSQVVVFPEMDPTAEVPEIGTDSWGLFGKSADSVMCAHSRMVIKRKGAERPVVVSCTLLPDDSAFELGATLEQASGPVRLNHRYCASFCVLGGASCGSVPTAVQR
ncbi:MAG: radical SAM protein [SAR324 cluster bacterium]